MMKQVSMKVWFGPHDKAIVDREVHNDVSGAETVIELATTMIEQEFHTPADAWLVDRLTEIAVLYQQRDDN